MESRRRDRKSCSSRDRSKERRKRFNIFFRYFDPLGCKAHQYYGALFKRTPKIKRDVRQAGRLPATGPDRSRFISFPSTRNLSAQQTHAFNYLWIRRSDRTSTGKALICKTRYRLRYPVPVRDTPYQYERKKAWVRRLARVFGGKPRTPGSHSEV